MANIIRRQDQSVPQTMKTNYEDMQDGTHAPTVFVGKMEPGNDAAALGKTENAAHNSGDVGVMLLAVRADAATALADDGDYIPLIVDASGRLHIAPLVAGAAVVGKFGVDQTTPGTTDAVSMRRRESTATLTIANGQTTSDAFTAAGATLYGVILPAAFTGTAISFTVCSTLGGTYVALYDILNALVSVAVTQGRAYDLPGELSSWPFWKIVSNGAEGGARSLVVVAKG